MIATLSGQVTAILPTTIVLETGGVGYELFITATDSTKLKVGQTAKFDVYEQIREDTHQLFGFSTTADKALFATLVSVNGVGPKLALAILNKATPEGVRQALATEEPGAFEAVPGVGKKTAARIIVDLRNKVVSQAASESGDDAAYAALRQLGFAPSQAKEALKAIPTDIKSDEDRIKFALRSLSRH